MCNDMRIALRCQVPWRKSKGPPARDVRTFYFVSPTKMYSPDRTPSPASPYTRPNDGYRDHDHSRNSQRRPSEETCSNNNATPRKSLSVISYMTTYSDICWQLWCGRWLFRTLWPVPYTMHQPILISGCSRRHRSTRDIYGERRSRDIHVSRVYVHTRVII